MGMQIGIMVYEQKRIMLENVLDKGYALIGEVDNDVVKVFKKEQLTNEFLKLRKIHFGYVETIAKIQMKNYGDFIRISNKDIETLVELVFSNIILKEKKVTRGRVYFGNGFAAPLTKEESDVGRAIYKDITKWVKKNIPYRMTYYTIKEKDYEEKIYIEDYLYDLIMNQGFRMR